MLSYPITGVREGTRQAERDGLYWNVSAVCSKDWDFPIRLIAETDGARTVLGVPQPGPDGLRLQTRLSNRSCPFSEQTRILTDQTPEDVYKRQVVSGRKVARPPSRRLSIWMAVLPSSSEETTIFCMAAPSAVSMAVV